MRVMRDENIEEWVDCPECELGDSEGELIVREEEWIDRREDEDYRAERMRDGYEDDFHDGRE
jgi:hypothetical protein